MTHTSQRAEACVCNRPCNRLGITDSGGFQDLSLPDILYVMCSLQLRVRD